MTDSEKERKAVHAIRSIAETITDERGYYLSYSGGKDSECLLILAEIAGVKYEIHHNHTTVDAPETVYHVRSIPGVIIHYYLTRAGLDWLGRRLKIEIGDERK